MVNTPCETTLDSVKFSEQSGAYTATYNHHEITPSMAVIDAVAEVLDIDPLELDPIFESIDTDALNGLLSGGEESPIHISFRFAGCDVTMSNNGRVRLTVSKA